MFTSENDIIRIGEGLRDKSLPKPEWRHAAHIAAAVWLLADRGDAAFIDMPDIIRAYNLATGVENTDRSGYHHTITIASLSLLRAEMGEGSLCVRVNRLLAAGYDKPDWLLRYYSRDCLFSASARLSWVEPDLMPFPLSLPLEAPLT